MKHALIVLAALLAALTVSTGSLQAAPAKPIAGDSNAPINISSDSFQADLNSKLGTWSGNVIVTQADMKLRANTVRMSSPRRSAS